jgi:hypothetical protein
MKCPKCGQVFDEHRDLVKGFEEFSRSLDTREKMIAFLHSAGIVTKTGELTEEYKVGKE